VSGATALALALLAGGAAAPMPTGSAGARAYQKCYACHALAPGRNDLSGPTLHGIVGRPVAAEPGFAYSPALARFAAGRVWDEPLLDRMIADPEALVPGTAMSFHGIADPAERAALIAWLKAGGGR
jgi:cytochrome c